VRRGSFVTVKAKGYAGFMRTDLAFNALCVAAILALAPAGAHAQAKLYKWVDEKGVTHWSDRAQPGAEKVDVQAAQGYRPSAAAPRATVAAPASRPDAGPVAYERVEIVRPVHDEVFVNTGGAVEIGAALSPSLAPGHRTWFVIDGKRLEDLSPAATAATVNAERGSHTVSFEVEDENGKVVATAPSITFHVRQTSIAKPPVGPALRQPQPRPRP
jgi:hypothetical protein